MIPKARDYSKPAKLTETLAIDGDSVATEDYDQAYPELDTGDVFQAVITDSDNELFADPDANYETVEIDSHSDGTISISRRGIGAITGVIGEAREWPSGSLIACMPTGDGYNQMRKNVVYGNWDGGKPDSNYGGMDSIDAGGV